MVKLTFKRQMFICTVLILIGVFVSAIVEELGVISKIMWTISGILFILNPVIPETSKNVENMRQIVRMVGFCWIVMAWFLGFTGY